MINDAVCIKGNCIQAGHCDAADDRYNNKSRAPWIIILFSGVKTDHKSSDNGGKHPQSRCGGDTVSREKELIYVTD